MARKSYITHHSKTKAQAQRHPERLNVNCPKRSCQSAPLHLISRSARLDRWSLVREVWSCGRGHHTVIRTGPVENVIRSLSAKL